MTPLTTCFFSQLAGKNVYSEGGALLGRIVDLAVAADQKRPRVAALILKVQSDVQWYGFSTCILDEREGQLSLSCTHLAPIPQDQTGTVLLKERFLDRQVVDLQGRRTVVVKDLRLAFTGEGAFVAAIDGGVEGQLRRWGLDQTLRRLTRLLKGPQPPKLIPWEEVEAIEFEHAPIRTSGDGSSLSRLHPADLADILEDLDGPTQMAVFSALDDEQAADVLEELETDAQISMIESLPVEKAADLLEMMPADEVADLLDELHEDKAEALLNEMDMDSSEDVRELMEYPDNTVGSLMSTEYVAFSENHTVEETINELRQMKPESDVIYYLYVVDSEERLISTVSLRDIIISAPEVKLSTIMNPNVVYVQDTDRIDILNDIIAKYSLLAVPVVGATRKLLGMVVINDIVETLLKARRKRL